MDTKAPTRVPATTWVTTAVDQQVATIAVREEVSKSAVLRRLIRKGLELEHPVAPGTEAA